MSTMDDIARGVHWLTDRALTAAGRPLTRWLCAIVLRIDVFRDAAHKHLHDQLFWPLRRRYACSAFKWPHNTLKMAPLSSHTFHTDMRIEEVAWYIGEFGCCDLSYGPNSQTFAGLTSELAFNNEPLVVQSVDTTDQIDLALQPVFVVIKAASENAFMIADNIAKEVEVQEVNAHELDSRCHLRFRDKQLVWDDDMKHMAKGQHYEWNIVVADSDSGLSIKSATATKKR